MSHPSNCFFFFVSRWNRAIFWPSVLHVPLYKTVFLRFLTGPKVQNLLPKICTKSPISSRLVLQIDLRCLGLPGGFRGWPIQRNHAKCCGADACCHGNEIWARRGDPVAYRLVCMCACELWTIRCKEADRRNNKSEWQRGGSVVRSYHTSTTNRDLYVWCCCILSRRSKSNDR